MTSNTVPSSTGRHGFTVLVALALEAVLKHNGIEPTAATGIAGAAATVLGGVLRWLISR